MSNAGWANHQHSAEGILPNGITRLLIAFGIAIGLHFLLLLRLPEPLPVSTAINTGEVRIDLLGAPLIYPEPHHADIEDATLDEPPPIPEQPEGPETVDLPPAVPEPFDARAATERPTNQSISEPLDPLPETKPIERLESLFPAPEPEPHQPRRLDLNALLSSRDAAIASLASPDRAHGARTGGERRLSVEASSSDYRYASYLEAWQRKVERIGNLNYPEEARRRNLYGSLRIQVSVRADGSLEGVRVLRSSGEPLLDQAAIDIVRLAAPFAPLPDNIRAETDVLDILRGWQFRRGAGFGAAD